MAKDTELSDDKETDDKLENGQLGDEKETPTDIRGAIKAAIKEQDEKGEEDTDGDDDDKAKEEDDKGKVQTRTKSVDSRDRAVADKVLSKEPKGAEEVPKGTEDNNKEQQVEPPPYYKTKGKAVWDKLAPEDKQLILAREKEVSDGFAQASPKVRAFDELEKVIAPRLPAIQRFGTTPAATIDRLFQWMEALSDQDESKRTSSFKQLAANFGIKFEQLGITAGDDATPEVNDTTPPAWAQGIVGEVTNLKQQLTTQQQAAADAAVTNWATAKDTTGTPLRPHYSKVNQLMYQLMVSGAVPMKDGTLDLDGAYEAACKLNPEVAALIQQEIIAKAEKEATEKAAKEAQLVKARAEKARKAGVGLKPAAPSMPSPQGKGKPNGTGKDSTSVRDSLRFTMDQLRDN